MQAFYDHPHLLDGALGRVFGYFAIAILIGKLVWEYRFRCRFILAKHYLWTAFTLGTLGLLVALNSTVLEASDPFGSKGMEFPDISTAIEILLKTGFGKAWLSFWVFLVMGVTGKRLPIQCLAILGMLASITLSSHAGSAFPYTIYWIDYIHLASALTWLGGLSILLVLKFTKPAVIGIDELKFFSKLALPVFLLALLSGTARIIIEYLQSQALAPAYVITLAIKIFMILIIMMIAFSLRNSLQHDKFSMSSYEDKSYDNKLSTEYFFATMLILVVGILTQLPTD